MVPLFLPFAIVCIAKQSLRFSLQFPCFIVLSDVLWDKGELKILFIIILTCKPYLLYALFLLTYRLFLVSASHCHSNRFNVLFVLQDTSAVVQGFCPMHVSLPFSPFPCDGYFFSPPLFLPTVFLLCFKIFYF